MDAGVKAMKGAIAEGRMVAFFFLNTTARVYVIGFTSRQQTVKFKDEFFRAYRDRIYSVSEGVQNSVSA